MVVRNGGRCGKSLACDSSGCPGQSSTEPQSGPMWLINPDIGTFYLGKSQRDAYPHCLDFLHNSSRRPRHEHTYPAVILQAHPKLVSEAIHCQGVSFWRHNLATPPSCTS